MGADGYQFARHERRDNREDLAGGGNGAAAACRTVRVERLDLLPDPPGGLEGISARGHAQPYFVRLVSGRDARTVQRVDADQIAAYALDGRTRKTQTLGDD